MNLFSKKAKIESKETNASPNASLDDTPSAVDAIIHSSISGNGLESYINIDPPQNGGAAPTLKMFEAALANCGVTCHIDAEKLKELEAEPIYHCDIVVARGIAPVNGVDGTASFRFEAGKKKLKPKENENGIIDYRDLGIVENVTRGQVLCIITPPTEGTPGISVKGKKLLQKKGKPVPSYIGKNTELNEEGTAILSQIDGQVEFDGRKINVNETFYVRGDVDVSTGNIKVASNLSVVGMVMSGFTIEAGENIDVRGVVENATIKAGGNITLQSGITGSELYCGGDLKCRFIENCNVLVKGEITAEYILNSDIKCGKSIKTVGKIAKIIGGSCVAGQDIKAGTIGSTANVKTRLELGTDYTIIERQQELLAKLPELEKNIESVKPLITLLRQLEAGNRLTADKKQLLDKIEYKYGENLKLQKEVKKELEEMTRLINTKGYGRIICNGTIYPGTTVVLGVANLSVTKSLINTSLYYSEGEICKGIAR